MKRSHSLLLLGLLASPLMAESLSEELAAVTREPRFAHAHWGILVLDLETDERLEEWNSAKLFAPASVTKIFSTAAALDDLGPEYRFETVLRSRSGPNSAGVLSSDLVLIASGDPTLGGRTTEDGHIAFEDSDHTYADFTEKASLLGIDPVAGLRSLAKQIADAGVKEITGKIQIDDRLFEADESSGSGPTKVTPLMVNDNALDFLITPGRLAGEAARVDVRPASRLLQIDAQIQTVDTANEFTIKFTREGPYQFHLRGRISQDHKPILKIQEILDPASFGRALFVEELEKVGIRLSASPFAANDTRGLPGDYGGWRNLATLRSPAFSENAKLILKVSHNLHASALPLLMAARHGERGLLDGMRREGEFLRRVGIPADGISFSGGAGGGRGDFASPEAAVTLLRHMAKHPASKAFRDAFPVLGVDGTLAKVVGEASPAKATVQAKTGTLLWENHLAGSVILTSKALAGYARTSHDRSLAFAFFVNGVMLDKSEQSGEIGRTLGRLCEIVHRIY